MFVSRCSVSFEGQKKTPPARVWKFNFNVAAKMILCESKMFVFEFFIQIFLNLVSGRLIFFCEALRYF